MTVLSRVRETASKRNRARQHRAEVRITEIVQVASIEADYTAVDRAGDLAIEQHFQTLYQLVDRPEEKDAVARAFAVWQRSERQEDLAVRDAVGDSVETLKANNKLWLHDGCGPDGAAA